MVNILFNNCKVINKSQSFDEFEIELKKFLEKENELKYFSVNDLIHIFDSISKNLSTLSKKDSLLISNNNIGFIIPWLKKNNISKTFLKTFGNLDIFDINWYICYMYY